MVHKNQFDIFYHNSTYYDNRVMKKKHNFLLNKTEEKEPQSSMRIAAISSILIILIIYLISMCPTIYSGDAPELATAGATFGIPHPPGYPLYVLCANIFSGLMPFGNPAWEINLMSVIAATGAVAGVFGIALLLYESWVPAVFAALGLGVGATMWSQALISEVYAFDLLLAAATLYSALKARQKQTLTSCALTVFLAASWTGHRTVNILYILSVLILLGPVLQKTVCSVKGCLIIALACIAPFLVFLYLPLASSYNPMLDTGDPETWQRFWDMVTASVYKQYLFGGGINTFFIQLIYIFSSLPKELGAAIILAPVGAVFLWLQKKTEAVALLYLAGANLFFAANYQVLDVMVFTLPSLLALHVLSGAAIRGMFGKLPKMYTITIIIGLVIATAVYTSAENNLREQTLCRDFARDALNCAEDNALILSNVDSVTFALWYMQYAESYREDILVVSKGRSVDWYQEQTKKQRPDLIIQKYQGADAASRWPAMLAENNAGTVLVYLTANMKGYFLPIDMMRLNNVVTEVPSGILMQIVPRDAVPSPEKVIVRNETLWDQLWPHAVKARTQNLATDMTALLLHYASMRVLFARYCLWHGHAGAAKNASQDVIELDTDELITKVNKTFQRKGFRYHMSDMSQQAVMLNRLALLLQQEKLDLIQIRRKLAGA